MRAEAVEILRQRAAEIPVNVEAVASDLGIRVWQSWTLPPNISGKIGKGPEPVGRSGYAIVVNANDGNNRQRFTIAHELAHYIYHHPYVGEGIADNTLYRSGLPTRLEVEANQLAAEMIMPARSIRYLMASGVRNAEQLAGRMQVSRAAMGVRLRQLNISLC